MDIKLKAVVLYSEGVKSASELSEFYGFSERSLRRWTLDYKKSGVKGLLLESTKPKNPGNKTPQTVINRVLRLKKKYPTWGSRRLTHQFNIPLHWGTVQDILKDNGLLIHIKAKPQPCKRFQRKHVDSM